MKFTLPLLSMYLSSASCIFHLVFPILSMECNHVPTVVFRKLSYDLSELAIVNELCRKLCLSYLGILGEKGTPYWGENRT